VYVLKPREQTAWWTISTGAVRSSVSEVESMRIIYVLVAGALGAVAMYLSDPDRGRARRAALRDQMRHTTHSTERWLRHSGADVLNRALGQLAEFRSVLSREQASDEVVVARVHSQLGHVLRHAHRVTVTADAGWVQLRGHVLPNEKD